MRQRLLLWSMLLVFLFAPTVEQSAAQSGSCPDLVLSALEMVGESCGDLSRNEACYGHSLVEAMFASETETDFSTPADRAPLNVVQTLRTHQMDEEMALWGVAVMSAQANLPDTLPGQSVNFVLYGDVTLQNAGDEQPAIGPVCESVTTAGANIRSGPGTNFNVIGSVSAGTGLQLQARNEAGDWLFVSFNGRPGWVMATLVVPDCDLMATLDVRGQDEAITYGPMQAFYFSTGFGQPACNEAPPSSLVIQSPEGYAVSLNANGVDVTLGSTVVFTTPEAGIMLIATLQGNAFATVGAISRAIPAGFQVEVAIEAIQDAGGNLIFAPLGLPSMPELIEAGVWDALAGAPGALFAMPIEIPDTSGWESVEDFCADPANADLCANPLFLLPLPGVEVTPPVGLDCTDPANALLCGGGLPPLPEGIELPPLPEGDDLPPLPGGDDLPPLPGGDDLPPLPGGDDLPPLPPIPTLPVPTPPGW